MPKLVPISIIIVVVILAGIGVWWFLTAQPNQTSKNTTTSSFEKPVPRSSSDEPAGINIVFTNNGFDREIYSVPAGQTVTIKNESSMIVQFSSDEHPTHTDNSELNKDALQPGAQGTFTPNKVGEWGVHDHEHSVFTTKLIVTG